MIKKYETCEIKYKDCDCFLEYTNFEDHLIEHKCLGCYVNYKKSLINFLIYTDFKFCNHNINLI